MEKITKKITVFLDALQTLEDILKIFYEYKSIYSAHPTEKNKQFFLGFRDATIQRFEYCTDLMWRVLQIYLENIEKVNIENSSPRGIIRDANNIKFLSESESKMCMEMVDSRNKTSHIYHQEMAEDIAQKVPEYYVLMKKIIDRMQDKMVKK